MLEQYGITAVVNCSNEDEYMPNNINYLRVYLVDDDDDSITPWLDEVYNFIDSNRQDGPVLVHCQAAVSRSPSFIIAYIAKKYGFSLETVIDAVKQKRPYVTPRQKFLTEIQEWLE